MPLPSFGRLSNRANAKSASGGRRRDSVEPTADAAEAADDPELSSYLAALAPETDRETTGSGRRFGDALVYQVRLNHIAGQQLKDLATQRGTSPQALAQEWVLERLSQEAQGDYQRPPQPQPSQPGGNGPDTDQFFLDRRQWEQPLRGDLR